MSKVLVVAPHPDDETLGCGGTLLRHKKKNDSIHWLIMTSMNQQAGFSEEKIVKRFSEVENVVKAYSFDSVHQAGFVSTELDIVPKAQLIKKISSIINSIEPDIIYLPYRNDVHSDHKVTFDAVIASTKSFRYPSINKIIAYETLSETEFGLQPQDGGFRPNLFVDISPFFEQKIKILQLYQDEISSHPFPRSLINVKSLAIFRGAIANCHYAESFMSLKEIWK